MEFSCVWMNFDLIYLINKTTGWHPLTIPHNFVCLLKEVQLQRILPAMQKLFFFCCTHVMTITSTSNIQTV